MIVHCEGCETGFHVDERLIKPTGSKVRCSKCRHVFMAYAPPAPADDAEEPLVLSDALSATETIPGPAEMSEVDLKLDETIGEAAGAEPELLDVEDLLADEPQPKAAFETSAVGGELDRDLTPTAADDTGDTLPALDELEIDLSMLDGDAETAAAAPEKGAPKDELELDLDFDSPALERAETGAAAGPKRAPEAAAEAAVQAGGAPGDLLDELDLQLEMADAKTDTLPKDTGMNAKSSEIDEIDISDLEDMLDDRGPAPAGTTSAAAAGIERDPDLEAKAAAPVEVAQPTDTLDLNMFADDRKTTGAPDSAVRDDGLDLSLDLEPETELAQAEASAEMSAEADELDFSDISAMLEREDKPVAAAAEETLEDVDLTIEDMPATAGSGEDLMLDLETLLDEGHGPAVAETPDEATEELDLEVVPAEAPDRGTDLEIELEPEAAVPPGERLPIAAAAQASVAAAARDSAATDSFSTEEFTSTGAPGATAVLEPEPAAKKKPAAVEPRRAGFRKPLLAVLGVAVLAIAALVLPRSLGINIPFLSEMDIEIPFIGDLFKSEPEDSAGRLKLALAPEGIAAEFIANSTAGTLCVVKGQVRNNYNQPRSALRVTVKLYAAGNAVLKTATVYAGNVLSNQELSSLDLITINARLMNSTGANNMNVGVQPGRSVPFMAVFSNLPASLEEYSVEVADSKP